jgi:phage terminase Nu1 subunit (DNA packaging protein)
MEQENLLTRQELAEVLGLSSRTIARMKQAGMPYVPVLVKGYKQFAHKFNLTEVRRWMDNQTVEGAEHRE